MMFVALAMGLPPSSPCSAQAPPRHWLHAGVMPPGAIGSQRLLRNGPLSNYIQPVEISVPVGTTVAAVSGGGFTTPHELSLKAGLAIGRVYRFRVEGSLNDRAIEIYPTVEVIDRLYPPPGKALEFPIPVQITAEEARLAADGAFVTRVIYLEDPTQALPIEEPVVEGRREQQYFEARPDQDPLVVADTLGRPVAILRIGSRLPGGPIGPGCGDPEIQLYSQTEQPSQQTAQTPRPDFSGIPQQTDQHNESSFGIETIFTY